MPRPEVNHISQNGWSSHAQVIQRDGDKLKNHLEGSLILLLFCTIGLKIEGLPPFC